MARGENVLAEFGGRVPPSVFPYSLGPPLPTTQVAFCFAWSSLRVRVRVCVRVFVCVCVCLCVYLLNCTEPRNPALSS